MEEQTSWKVHAFTLMIFGGIVVLCSIFFVLGMLVGRTQTIKLATAAEGTAKAQPTPPKEAASNDRPDLTFYSSVEKTRPAAVFPAPGEAKLHDEPASTAPAAPSPSNAINLQIAALKKQGDAEKQVDALRKKGFRAFVLSPAPDEANRFYRVQIGASDQIEAETLKQQLEAAGIKAIIKK